MTSLQDCHKLGWSLGSSYIVDDFFPFSVNTNIHCGVGRVRHAQISNPANRHSEIAARLIHQTYFNACECVFGATFVKSRHDGDVRAVATSDTSKCESRNREEAGN